MKDILILIVIAVITAALLGHLEININPFYVRLPMWHRVVGLLFIIIGWIIWEQGERLDAYSKELKKGMDITIEQIKANKK